MSKFTFAEYIWLDGAKPTRRLRSKTRLVKLVDNPSAEDFPEWSFDGSSTSQATGDDSDCVLNPVCFVNDPLRSQGDYLVLCEVNNPDGTPHESNSREQLRAVLDAGAAEQNPWIGFEQEYTLFEHRNPLGWPEDGFPGPQGPYYCGVGAREVFGRDLVEEHARKCNDAGILFYGINAEVMPGQWEFQVGFRGDENEANDALTVSDHMWLSRWLLLRVAEDYNLHASFDNKPIKGDWNGAGMHTNFSTDGTRNKSNGMEAIENAIQALSTKHDEHVKLYGHGLHERLTGDHETCDIATFRAGVADRGGSIRIPQSVHQNGYGYLEDRRPGANSDPYLVATRLISTICDIEVKAHSFSD